MLLAADDYFLQAYLSVVALNAQLVTLLLQPITLSVQSIAHEGN